MHDVIWRRWGEIWPQNERVATLFELFRGHGHIFAQQMATLMKIKRHFYQCKVFFLSFFCKVAFFHFCFREFANACWCLEFLSPRILLFFPGIVGKDSPKILVSNHFLLVNFSSKSSIWINIMIKIENIYSFVGEFHFCVLHIRTLW